MGYLTDIVRDSRRRADAPRAPGVDVAVGDVELSSAAPVFPDGFSVGPPAARSAPASVERIREEGSGQRDDAGQYAAESGFVTRQVVGPSPSEHIPAAGLPEATAEGLFLPNPVAHKQAGCESARTVTDDFRVEQTESFRDGDSNNAPAVSGVKDGSSVLESSPGYAAAPRAGKVSAETQGRRQAGVESRAGSTTPPEQYAIEAAAEPAVQHVVEPAAGPGSMAFTEPAPQSPRQGHAVPPGVMRSEDGRSTVSPETGSFVDDKRRIPLRGVAVACTVTAPASVPAAEVRFGHAEEPEQHARQRSGEEKRGLGNPSQPLEPRVRIGTIEVVVVSPAPVEAAPTRGERSRPDPASRNYLRNF